MAVSLHLEPYTAEELEVLVQFPVGRINPPSQSELHAAIVALGGSIEGERIRLGSWPIRLIVADTPLSRAALDDAPAVDFDAIPVRQLSPEHLCAMTVVCGSEPGQRYRHYRQITMFIEHDAVDVSMVSGLLACHGFGSLAEEFLAWLGTTTARTPKHSPYWVRIAAGKAKMRERNIRKPWMEKVASLERLREVALTIRRSTVVAELPRANIEPKLE